MPFRTSIFLFSFFLFFSQIWGQINNLDSLTSELKNQVAVDSNRCATLARLGLEYMHLGDERTDSVLLVLWKDSQSIDWVEGQKLALSTMATHLENQAKWNNALPILYRLLDLHQTTQDASGEIKVLNEISGIHYRIGNLDMAVEYAEKSLIKSKEEGMDGLLGPIYTTLGAIHLEWAKENGRSDFERDSLIDQSTEYFQGALTAAEKMGSKFGYALTVNNLSATYKVKGDPQKAVKYAEIALATHREIQNLEGEIISGINVGEGYMDLGQYNRAIGYFEASLNLARKHHYTQFELNALGSLSTVHRRMGNTDQALSYLDAHYILKDSLFSVEKVNALAEQSAIYEKEKTEQKNLWLEQRNEILSSRNLYLTIYGLILAALSFILVGFVVRFRKQNRFIAQQAEQLKALDQVRNHFFGIIAHDLRNPLLSFQGLKEKINYLTEKGQHERLDAFFHQLEESSKSLSHLLDNLLKWALSQKGAIPHHPKSNSLSESVQGVIRELNPLILDKRIKLEIEIPEQLIAFSDLDSLSVVIRNLLHNAIKFSPPGEIIRIEGSQEGQATILSIKDKGPGIPKDQIQNLFMEGKSQISTGSRGEKGSGLGLPLAWELTQLNKGHLEVTSDPGKGTAFSLTLPRSPRNDKIGTT